MVAACEKSFSWIAPDVLAAWVSGLDAFDSFCRKWAS